MRYRVWRRRSGRVGVLALALALAVSAGAVAATAGGALNDYSAVLSVTQSGGGSASAPAPMGLAEQLEVQPAASTNAAPLTSLGLTLPQVTSNSDRFPTCGARQVNAVHSDAGCSSAALVATGIFTGTLWSPAEPTVAGQRCYGDLDIFNGGHDTLTAFLSFPAGFWCDDLQTGSVPAWTGTLTEYGTTLRINLALPSTISTNTGNTGLYTAMSSLSLHFLKLSAPLGHRTVGFLASTSCSTHRRPAEFDITASDGAGSFQRSSLVQLAHC